MSMLKDLIETAAAGATSAGAIAGFRTPLGDGKKKKKKTKMKRRGPVGSIYGFRMVGENYHFKNFLTEVEDSDFDGADVIAKLKSAAKSAELKGEDTTAFALEDENGTMVKVWVPNDQADDFESALEMALGKNDDDTDEENTGAEIAEVLFNLRKDFDIVNVEWGEIPEDQEEALPADVEVEGEPGEEGELEGEGGLGDEEMEAEPDEAAELGDTGEEDAKTALQSVIDMMKADAEARKAEAEAKQKAAEADIAKYNKQAAAEKVKQEEEILDMEAYYDKQKEEKSEADRLAKLAKYRHDVAADSGASIEGGAPDIEVEKDVDVDVEMPEDEEYARRVRHARPDTHDTMMSKAELGDLVLRALRRR